MLSQTQVGVCVHGATVWVSGGKAQQQQVARWCVGDAKAGDGCSHDALDAAPGRRRPPGRRSIGVELSPQYVARAAQRLEQVPRF